MDHQQTGVLRVLQSRSETRAFYDKISGVYDLLSEGSEGPVSGDGLARLALQAGQHVLEIGYGTGHRLVEMAKQVGTQGRVFGIDLSQGMRKHAQARLDQEHSSANVELLCGDATHLPYPHGSMDAVFMSFTLELFDTAEIPAVLAECQCVLRPAGRIGVVSLTKEGKEGFAVEAYEWTHRHFPNLLDCRPIFVRRALEEAGFSIQETSIVSMWVPVEIVIARNI